MARVDPLLVTHVLGCLVAVAAADRRTLVRRTVLHALTPTLDPFLAKVLFSSIVCVMFSMLDAVHVRATKVTAAQAEVVQNLFPCMHDTDDEARAEALHVSSMFSSLFF
jgi:hypothetical protein